MNLKTLLKFCIHNDATSFHLIPDEPPFCRIERNIRKIKHARLSNQKIKDMLLGFLSKSNRKSFDLYGEVTIPFEIKSLGRFRVTIFKQLKGLSASFRMLASDAAAMSVFEALELEDPGNNYQPSPTKIYSLNELGIKSELIEELNKTDPGFIVVSGAVGSGKTTLISAILNNLDQPGLTIVTLENPIEYRLELAYSQIHQIAVTTDTKDYETYIERALNKQPDILYISSLRCPKSINKIMAAAKKCRVFFELDFTTWMDLPLDYLASTQPENDRKQFQIDLKERFTAIIQTSLANGLRDRKLLVLQYIISSPELYQYLKNSNVVHINYHKESANLKVQSICDNVISLLENHLIDYEEAKRITSLYGENHCNFYPVIFAEAIIENQLRDQITLIKSEGISYELIDSHILRIWTDESLYKGERILKNCVTISYLPSRNWNINDGHRLPKYSNVPDVCKAVEFAIDMVKKKSRNKSCRLI